MYEGITLSIYETDILSVCEWQFYIFLKFWVMVKMKACRLLYAKPLHEPMPKCCQMDPLEQARFNHFRIFYSRKCIWKRCKQCLPFCTNIDKLIRFEGVTSFKIYRRNGNRNTVHTMLCIVFKYFTCSDFTWTYCEVVIAYAYFMNLSIDAY